MMPKMAFIIPVPSFLFHKKILLFYVDLFLTFDIESPTCEKPALHMRRTSMEELPTSFDCLSLSSLQLL